MATERGHAFICYVREDTDDVDSLTQLLRDAGIPVWRDTESLWPGEDWKAKIREAITTGTFAFIACFSTRSMMRGISGQYPELYLAVEEYKRRQPGVPWIFPVRFDDCDVPKLDLGGGRTLSDIQWADLFGASSERNGERLVGAVKTILQASTPAATIAPTAPAEVRHAPQGSPAPARSRTATAEEPSIAQRLKDGLRAERGDILVHDLVMPIADRVLEQLADREAFPTEASSVDVRRIVAVVNRYWTIVDPLLDVLVIAGLWSTDIHERTWTEVTQRVAIAAGEASGNVALLAVRTFPLLPVVYATGIAAVHRCNFGPLRAVAIDATVKDHRGRLSVVARATPWQPFADFTLPAQVLALEADGEVVDDELVEALRTQRRGHRYTPVHDLLHARLRPRFARIILDDDDYSDTFDRLEVLLGLLVADQRLRRPTEGPWVPHPPTGRFTWRDRYAHGDQVLERRMLAEVESDGERWPPLRGGLFGGQIDRVRAAFDIYFPIVEKSRSQRW